MDRKIIGIMGGMGPLAAADIFMKIIEHTKARTDQEHLRVIMDSNCSIPDRTEALVSGGESPVPEMTKSARTLESAGADFIIMACSTAHGFADEVRASVSIPIISMIDVTVEAVKSFGIKRAGLLTTTGTVDTGLYQKAFEGSGVELILPPASDMPTIMDLIYGGVKASRLDYDASDYLKVVERLIERGAETMILASTELPPAMEMYGMSFPRIDPTLELALAAITEAGGELLDPHGRIKLAAGA